MKILYVLNDTFRIGGTESVVFNYFKNINCDEYKIDFMVHSTLEELENNEIYNNLCEMGVKVFCVTPRRISIKHNITDIKKVFLTNKYDIVHSHADAANAFILYLAEKCGVKIRISHCHSSAIRVKPNSIRGILHNIFLQGCRYYGRCVATNYMACSDISAKWLFGRKNFSKGNVYILNNAIDTALFAFNPVEREEIRKSLDIENNFVIGHVGRFTDEKNHLFMLNLMKSLVEVKKNVKLLLIGDGPNKDYMIKKSAEMNLKKNIIFFGKSTKVNILLNAMDLFILPSKYEGLSLSLVEAQNNGLRCIVTDSNTVSKSSAFSPYVEFLRLENMNAWVEYISNCDGVRNENAINDIKSAGYDIKKETRKLEDYYRQLYNDKY